MTLYPFQEEGVEYILSKHNAILADDMGLGKTRQAIEVIRRSKPEKTLIVCPKSLILNWRNELDKWGVFQQGIIITNYEKLKNQLHKDFDLAIFDEAHYLKNPKSQRSKLAAQIKTRKLLLLTGTPLSNRPIEIFPLLVMVDPQTWNPKGKGFFQFAKRYANARRIHHLPTPCAYSYAGRCSGCHWDYTGASNLEELSTRLRETCLIRRTKSEVLKDLPTKIRQVIVLEDKGDSLAKSTGLDAIDLDNYDSVVSSIRGKKFAFEEISAERQAQGLRKIKAAVAHIEETLEQTDKVVVFCHHIIVLNELWGALAPHNYQSCIVSGNTSQDERQSAVDAFQKDPTRRVFLGTIGSAGVGITLTAASTVIFVESDWDPSKTSQAEDRCHRIGQKNSVLVQHLVLNNTLDARIIKVMVQKQMIIDKVLNDA